MAESADQPERISLPILEAGHRVREVAYGQSLLRIQKNGIGISDDRLRKCLARLGRGEAGADDVAREYVRARIVGHTPGFRIDDADLDQLVGLIAANSGAPRIHASGVADLPDALLRDLPIPASEPLTHPLEPEHHRLSGLRSRLHLGH